MRQGYAISVGQQEVVDETYQYIGANCEPADRLAGGGEASWRLARSRSILSFAGKMKVLILEDDVERASAFAREVTGINSRAEVLVWQSARKMCQEIAPHLPDTVLISLDHDLPATDESGKDSGSGMDAVTLLSSLRPSCPVIVHTSNTDASWSMINELRHSGWRVERVGPVGMGADWVHSVWSPAAHRLMQESNGESGKGE